MDEQRRVAFFYAYGWNQSTLDYDVWLGNATRDAIAKLGSRVKVGELIGYEPADNHPSGWAFRAPAYYVRFDRHAIPNGP
jgi:hypothetical protein